MHPPPVTVLPTLHCLPLFVSGMPMDLDILDLAAEMPVARFHENPPLFILPPYLLMTPRQRPPTPRAVGEWTLGVSPDSQSTIAVDTKRPIWLPALQ